MYFYLVLMIIISYVILDIYRLMKKVNERNIRQVDFIDDNSFSNVSCFAMRSCTLSIGIII